MAVLPRAAREPVRVEHRHEPEVDPRMCMLERADDRDPGRLVAVDAADDQDARSRPRDVHELDRAVIRRIADDNRGG